MIVYLFLLIFVILYNFICWLLLIIDSNESKVNYETKYKIFNSLLFEINTYKNSSNREFYKKLLLKNILIYIFVFVIILLSLYLDLL